MEDNTKIKIRNLTDHRVGFSCTNYPASYVLNGGQYLNIKWEHLQDAAYNPGLTYMFRNSMLKVETDNENYDEIMSELQLDDIKEIIEKSLSLEEAKKLLSAVPLQINLSKIKKEFTEGTETSKQNIVLAAIDLKVRDYTLNKIIKDATGTDVIKTLELKESENKKEA